MGYSLDECGAHHVVHLTLERLVRPRMRRDCVLKLLLIVHQIHPAERANCCVPPWANSPSSAKRGAAEADEPAEGRGAGWGSRG